MGNCKQWSENVESQKMKQRDVELLKIEEAARRLSMSRASVYKLMDQGELAYVKLGRASRIAPESIQALIAKNTVGACA